MKKSFVNVLKFVLGSALLMFTSCEIGLGSAVDTEPPSIRLLQPEADSIVRDKIILEGTWSDDLKIRNVKLHLKDVNNPDSIIAIPNDAVLTGSETGGTWACEIDTKGLMIPDGTYVATATAYDDAEHSSISSTTFSIDNTPPLIVLENPTTTDISKPNEYGQTFTITGKAADDSDVDSIDFIFYDKDGNELHRKNISGVGTQLEVSVASWGDEVYNKIYGTDRLAGDKAYYVGLIAYDGARKVPAEAGDKGNAATSFYLWDELEAQIGIIKTSVGYKVMNGRSAATEDDKTKWKSALENLKRDRATFSLNPVNNPYFEVSRYEGFVAGQGNLDANEFTNKNTLVLNLYRGRDKKAIKVETIGVYLRECTKQGVKIEGAAPVVLLQPYADKDGNVYKDAAGNPLISKTEHDDLIKSLDSSYTATFSVNNEVYTGLAFNKYYVLDVVGYDINGVGVENPLCYGFKMVTTATPPTITVTSPASGGNIPKSISYKVEGLAKTQEDGITIAIYKEKAEGTPFATSASGAVTIGEYDKDQISFPFSFVVNTTGETVTDDVLPKYVIEVTSSSGLVSTQEVKIDPVLPEIGDCSISPTVEETVNNDTVTYVNGTVLVKQSLSDNQMIKLSEYSLDDGATWKNQAATNMLAFNVDTTQYTDESEKSIKIRVTDTAGNVNEGEIKLNIKQRTDAPKISLTNANMTVTDVAQISTTTNLFGTVTNNQLLGTVSDDDGIDKIYITVTNKDTGAVYVFPTDSKSAEYAAGKTVGGRTTHNLSFNLPTVEGLYEIKLKVVDSKQDTTGYNLVETASFLVAVDNGAPNLTISSVNNAYQPADANFILKGSTNDADAEIGIFKDLSCTTKIDTDETSRDASSFKPDSDKKWQFSVKTDDGTHGDNGVYTIYVRIKDKYGQSTTQSFLYKLDKDPPVFEITEMNSVKITDADLDNEIKKYATAKSLYTVRGNVKDVGPAGLADNLYYIVLETETTPEQEPDKDSDGKYYDFTDDGKVKDGWKPAIISKNADPEAWSTWVANIDLGEKNDDGSRKFEEGKKYKLYLSVKDNANNTALIDSNKSSKVVTFTLDSNNPVIESMGLEDEGANSYVYVKTKDAESGIGSVTLVLNSVEQDDAPVQPIEDAEDPTGKDPKDVLKKYKFLVDLSSVSGSSDIKYTIKVKDNAGNSESKPVQSINNTAPSIDFADSWNSSLYRKGDYYYTKEDIVIDYTVKATDNGISSIKYNENESGDNSEYTKTAADASFPTTKTGTITITKPVSSKKVDNVFTATNKYNNSNAQTLKYIFDCDVPTITLNSDTTVKTGIDNFFNATKVLLIEGTAADASNATAELNSGISEIKYSLVSGDVNTAGTWDDVQGTLNWKLKLDLTADTYAEGRYTLFFKSIDNVGNESAITKVKLIADKKEPEFKITKVNGTPASALASYYPGDVVIEGTLTDSYLSEYSVKVNGTVNNFDTGARPSVYSTNPLASQTWKLTLPSSETDYRVVITAKDKVGNTIPSTILTTSIDTSAPKFTISEINGVTTGMPDASSVVYATYGNLSSFFKISGEVTDAGKSGLGSYMYYKLVKEGDTPPTNTNGVYDLSSWETVAIEQKQEDGVNKNVWLINANFGNVSGLVDGKDCDIYIATKDNAGNVSKISESPSNKIKVRIDGIAPVVDVQPAISYDSTNNKNIVSFKVHDAESGVKSFVLKNKKATVSKTFSETSLVKSSTGTVVTCEILPTDLNSGENLLTIEITDYAGNTTITDSVTVNKSAADITFSAADAQYVNGGYNYYNGTFTISGSYSVPAGSALKSLTVNGGDPTSIDTTAKTFTYKVPATDTEESTITIKTITSFGVEQTKTYNYVVDTTAPKFTISKIDGKAETAASLYSTYGKLANYFVIEGSTSDAKSGVQDSGVGNYLYYKMVKGSTAPASTSGVYDNVTSWDKTNITKSNGNWTADLNFKNVSGLTDGDDCYIYFATVDNVGNVSTIAGNPSDKIKVRIDGVAPVFAAAPTVALGGTGTQDKAVISVKAKDVHSSLAVADVKLIRDGTLLDVSSTASATADASGYKTYSFTLTSANLVDGLNNFTIEATDAAGNKGTSSSVTIDNSAPEITTSHSLSYVDAEGYYYSNADFDVTSVIKVTSGQNKIASVTGASLDSGDTYKQTVSGASSTGKSEYEVKAKSIFGKESTATVKYVIDTAAPTFVLSNYTGYTGTPAADTSALIANVTTFGNKESYFTVEGKIADTAAAGKVASGYVTNVYYNVAKTEPAKTSGVYNITATGWKSTPVQADGSFSLPLKFSDYSAVENDAFTIYLAAKDNAGNISVPATYKLTVQIDGEKPTVGTPVLTIGDSETTIVVPASDGGSGIDETSAVITLNDEVYTKAVKTLDSQNGEYKFTIDNTDSGLVAGKNTFVVTVTDKAGNYRASNQIIINNDAPVLSSVEITDADLKSKKGEFVYENASFDISGNVTVGSFNKVKSLKWTDTYGETSTILKSGISTVSSGAFTDSFDPNDTTIPAGQTKSYAELYENNLVTRTYIAENVYGESSTTIVKFVTDITKPEAIAIKVGGKSESDLATKWLNASALKVEGSYLENGSGLSSVKIKLNNVENEAAVTSNINSGNTYYEFNSTISGFVEGNTNTLVFETTDKAGNVALSKTVSNIKVDITAPQLEKTYKPGTADGEQNILWYKTGDIEWKSFSSVILTNKSSEIKLHGSYSDNASGITAITVSSSAFKDANAITATMTPSAAGALDGTWEATIGTTQFNLLTLNSYTVTVSAIDAAGNKNDAISFELQVDTHAPEIEVTSPSTSTTLNGTITLSGSLEEENSPVSLGLYYVFKKTSDATAVSSALSDWTLLKEITTSTGTDDATHKYNANVSEIYGWKVGSYNINAVLEAATATSGTFYLLPVAYDKAGNCNVDITDIKSADYSASTYSVDLDADRPTIKLTSLTSEDSTILKYDSTVSGTIEDDDGVIKTLKISPTPITTEAGWTGVAEVPLNSGAFSYIPPKDSVTDKIEDGEKTMYFYIKDAQNSVFITSNATTGRADGLYMPKIRYKTSSDYTVAETNNAVVKYVFDSNPPSYTDSYIAYSDKDTTPAVTDATTKIKEFTNKVGGTERQNILLKISAYDANGIDSVTATVDGVKAAGSSILTCTKGTTDSDTGYTNYILNIDLSDVDGVNGTTTAATSGSKSVVFTITDKSGISTTTEPVSFTVDNDGPVIGIISPAKNGTDPYADTDLVDVNEAEMGVVTIIGTTSDGSAISEFKYLALDDINYATAATGVKTSANAGATSTSWTLELSGLPGDPTTLETKYKTKIVHNATTDIYAIPVYFYAKDELGNETTLTTYELKYNPYGDRPTVDVTSPSANANLNGTIQIIGSATDNVSIDSVYVQIDVNKDGKFDSDDITLLEAMLDPTDGTTPIYTIYNESSTFSKPTPDFTASVKTVDGVESHDDFWGIKANGRASWSLSINKFKELQCAATSQGDGTNKFSISYRVAAMDNNCKLGSWSEVRSFVIDTNIPQVPVTGTIVGYSDADRTTKVSDKAYAADMFLTTTGNYNELQITISDKSGIQKVEYYTAADIEGLNSATTPATATISRTDDATNFTSGSNTYYSKVVAKIPLNKINNTTDTLAIKVVAYKNSETETTAYCNYNVKFDDTAPTMNYVTFNGDKVTSVADDEDATGQVVNSNGVFTLGGKVTDYGAGFARALFYYNRPAHGTNPNRVYDPLVAPTTSGSDIIYNGKIVVTDADTETFGGQPMYGYKNESVSVAADLKTLTLTGNTSEKNIFKGGVVYINGAWFDIADVTPDASGYVKTVVLSDDTKLTASGTVTAFFPYVRVINNTGTEKNGFDTGSTNSAYTDTTDDGDGMPESVIKSQSSWTYDASVRSNFIPDGPGAMVVFVFDKAGNCSAARYDGSVQNNAPRITKLWLGTDLTGDNKFDRTEFTSYDILEKAGGEQRAYTMNTADFGGKRFRVLDQLAVVAEFVGGNNANNQGIKLAYNNNASSESGKCVKKADDDSNWYDKKTIGGTTGITAANSFFTASDYSGSGTTGKYGYIIPKDDIGADSIGVITDLTKRSMSFTFWDDTEDSEQGTNSGYCYLRINDFAVIQSDNFAPSVTIDPFFWNNADDNSLYQNDYMNGHIDLPAYITGAARKSDDADDGLYYANNILVDPKVSGKISIRGSAVDEHTLGKIWASFDGFTPSEAQQTFGGTTAKTVGGKTYYCVAYKDSDGVWQCATGTVAGNVWKFSILSDTADQNGNVVKWQLDIDTSAITGNMGNDKVVRIIAEDKATTSHLSSTTKTAGAKLEKDMNGNWLNTYDVNSYNVPYYQMDVVPYISGVEGANRSRLGRYPVRAGQTIKITGFNFAAEPKVYRKTSAGASSEITVTTSDSSSITVTAPEYSGYIYAQWVTGDSAVTTPNNDNVNTIGYNIENGYVAGANDGGKSIANAAGKNFWTDDRYISVWNVGGALANSLLPVNGTIENFGSATGKIFNGSIDYQYVTADGPNRTYGIYGSNAKMIYNGWFQNGASRLSNLNFQANTSYKLPPAEVDTCIVGDKPMYVVLDNGIDGSGTWSSGLYCAIDGWQIPQSANQVKPIEMQGNGANDNPDSSDGFDDILFQFRNPKIGGYKVSNNEYYAYVSYYDSYARCLKYSKFKFTGTGEGDKSAVVAMYGNEKTGIAVVDGYDTLQNNFSGAGWDCGEFSDIKVDGTIPVIAYFSNSSSTANGGSGKVGLRIARGGNTAPKTYRVDGTTTIADYANEWIYTDVPTPAGLSDFGRYVSMEMDSSGGLHIIAQGTSSSTDSYELWYMYLTKKEDGHYTKAVEMKVDATSSVGRFTDIKLGKTTATGLYCYPTVTYMDEAHLTSTRAVKVAYLNSVTSSGEGDSAVVTGVWECMTDPATYAATNQKLSIVLNTYDNLATPKKNKLAVGINSDLFVIDCLRNESDDFTNY